ncbi:MAG: diaminopimelate decarboxylase [Spirochaetaceae bacterium]
MNVTDISSSFNLENSRLQISGVDINRIVKEVGTPLFIYDAQTIKNRYNYLRDNLPKEVDIFYAMKANANISIVKQFVSMGAGVEVASAGELYVCKKLGMNPKDIVFGGPSKTDEDIEIAIDMGIYAVNAESINEIRRIDRVASSKNTIMDVELRINPEFEIEGVVVSLGGGSKKFGIDSETISDVIIEAQKLKNIRLQGIHIYAGTGIRECKSFLSNMENCFKLAKELDDKHFKVESIDVGGGLSIPYSDDDPEFNIEGLSFEVTKLINQYPFIKDNNTRIITEPGRYLAGQCGVYITEVIDKKHSRGRDYLLVDGGAQHLLRPALIEVSQPTFNISRTEDDFKKYDVGGSLCTSIDFLGKDIELPVNSQIGDYIGVFCAGAYGYAESMPFFLSHDIAPEVLIYSGKYHIIRPRIFMKDLVDAQSIPEDLV